VALKGRAVEVALPPVSSRFSGDGGSNGDGGHFFWFRLHATATTAGVKRNTFFNRVSRLASCGALFGLFAAASACSSSDGSMADGGNTSVTFTEIYTTIINPMCVSCHDAQTKAGNLDMSSQSVAYTNLVGTLASGTFCASENENRVTPGNTSQSILYSKVSAATPVCGSRMPLGSSLTSDQISLIGSWITAGAAND
jgi:hypothetical protein